MDGDFAAFLEELTPDQLNSTLVLVVADHGALHCAVPHCGLLRPAAAPALGYWAAALRLLTAA